MLDRLERVGYIRRLADKGDRRRVLVELTPRARKLATEFYGSFEAAAAGLGRYRPDQLTLLRDFLDGGADPTNSKRRSCGRPRSGQQARSGRGFSVPGAFDCPCHAVRCQPATGSSTRSVMLMWCRLESP